MKACPKGILLYIGDRSAKAGSSIEMGENKENSRKYFSFCRFPAGLKRLLSTNSAGNLLKRRFPALAGRKCEPYYSPSPCFLK